MSALLEAIGNIWDSIQDAISSIKALTAGFFSIVNSIFDLVPDPFGIILKVVLVVIIALIAVKIVRG